MDRDMNIEVGVDVKGKDRLQDLADILRELQDKVTIRDNRTVNVYLSTNTFFEERDDQ